MQKSHRLSLCWVCDTCAHRLHVLRLVLVKKLFAQKRTCFQTQHCNRYGISAEQPLAVNAQSSIGPREDGGAFGWAWCAESNIATAAKADGNFLALDLQLLLP